MVKRIIIVVVILAVLGGVGYAYQKGLLGTIPNPSTLFATSEFQISQAAQRSGECDNTQTDTAYTLSSPSVLLGLPVYIDFRGFAPNEQVDMVVARDDQDTTASTPNTEVRRTATMKAGQCGTLGIEIRATGDQYRGNWLIQAVGRESHKTVGIAQFAIR